MLCEIPRRVSNDGVEDWRQADVSTREQVGLLRPEKCVSFSQPVGSFDGGAVGVDEDGGSQIQLGTHVGENGWRSEKKRFLPRRVGIRNVEQQFPRADCKAPVSIQRVWDWQEAPDLVSDVRIAGRMFELCQSSPSCCGFL